MTFGNILVHVNGKTLVDTLGGTVLNAKAETLKVKTGNVQAKTVADTLEKWTL